MQLNIIWGMMILALGILAGFLRSPAWIIFPLGMMFAFHYVISKIEIWKVLIRSQASFDILKAAFYTASFQIVLAAILYMLGRGVANISGYEPDISSDTRLVLSCVSFAFLLASGVFILFPPFKKKQDKLIRTHPSQGTRILHKCSDFHVPKTVLDAWEASGKPIASRDDIDRMEQQLGVKLPSAYVDFVMTYGFVCFDRDKDDVCNFLYRKELDSSSPAEYGRIRFLKNPEYVIMAYNIMTSTEDPDDPTLPAFPKEYIPVGGDDGQGLILLEISPEHGRVWYWSEEKMEWRWGTEGNTKLGFVADNFYDFINNLLPRKDVIDQ